MQQSLHILQLPVMELRQLVAEEMRVNPVLEEDFPEREASPQEKVESSSGLNDEWNEYYAQRSVSEPWSAEAQERRQHFFDSQTRQETLQQHLMEQMASWSRRDMTIGIQIVGNIDDQGYLRESVEAIADRLRCDEEDVEAALVKVQQFDPAGVGARDLGECLMIQLARLGRQNGTEGRVVKHHLDELGRKRLPEIARQLHVPLGEVQRAAEFIATLDPRPGRMFSVQPEQVIVPDVIVERDGDGYTVSLSQDELPHLRIGDAYKDMLSQSGSGKDVREYLREKIKGGKFLIKSIQQRQQTILNISREIVVRQREFFDQGPSQLKPMTMSQVAEAVGVHETTVSRAASGKYMATPHGVFELKYFFTHGYTTAEGQSVSNESVRQEIATLVKAEDSHRPMSDQEIVVRLSERGVPVARRTVAKYRDQLGILPSHLRKSF